MTVAPRRSTIRALSAAALAVVVAVGAAGCADADAAPPEQRRFEIGGGGAGDRTLTIDIDDSPLVLVAADRTDVRVTRWFDGIAYGGSTGARWSMEDGTLTLRPVCRGAASCDIRHRVEVPRDIAVRVAGDNGAVTARGFRSALAITSDNGRIRVRDSTGPLELTGRNASVEATGVGAREVTAEVVNGRLTLALARVPDRVEARGTNGSATIELPHAAYRVDAGADNGSARVEVPRDAAGEHVVSAHSVNGDVTVRSAR
ncbi:MAG TPA: DUF4097 family beta strand repeat-containing protein [Streptomyces sp.]|nr:DUF4097 family beta strand repeat-containing protein [Streptomyces sp.]